MADNAGGAGSIPATVRLLRMHRGYSDVLRDAPEPMTADLVERVALDCWIATEAPVAATLLCRVKATLVRMGRGACW